MSHYRHNILCTAVLHWKRGVPLPVDLETKLLAEGYDVETLQNRYER